MKDSRLGSRRHVLGPWCALLEARTNLEGLDGQVGLKMRLEPRRVIFLFYFNCPTNLYLRRLYV
jgi:hypothetical protein